MSESDTKHNHLIYNNNVRHVPFSFITSSSKLSKCELPKPKCEILQSLMRSIFTLLVIAVFAAFALRSNFVAMLMYWWFGIFRPQEWMWWDVSSLRLPLLAAAIFIVPMCIKGLLPSFKDNIAKLLCLLIILAVVSGIVAGCEFPVPFNSTATAILLVVTSFSHKLLVELKHVFIFLVVAAFCLSFHSARTGISSVLQGTSLYDANIGGGGFTGSNAMALGTAMGIFFLIFGIQCLLKERYVEAAPFFKGKNGWRKILITTMFISVIGGVFFVIQTSSRGSALALIAGFIVWILLHPRRVFLGISLLLVGMLAVGAVGLPTQITDRLGSAFVDESELDKSAASRPHYWKTAKAMVADNPLGIGVGCYQSYYNRYDSTEGDFGLNRSVHSSHYAILAELGYAGIIVWALIFTLCLWRLWKMRSKNIDDYNTSYLSAYYVNFSNALICGLLVFLLGGSFYEMPYNDYIWIMFACIIAVHRQHKTLGEQIDHVS